jgi:hypothetical protein
LRVDRYFATLRKTIKNNFHAGWATRDWEKGIRMQGAMGSTSESGSALDLRVYGVTDPGCNKSTGRTLVEAVTAAIAGGATVIQIREKNLTSREFVDLARQVRVVNLSYLIYLFVIISFILLYCVQFGDFHSDLQSMAVRFLGFDSYDREHCKIGQSVNLRWWRLH